MSRAKRRPMLQALLGAAALLLQLALPALHPLHAASIRVAAAAHDASPAAAADHVVAHDGLGCVFCAAAAQGRAGVLVLAPAPAALITALDVVAPPAVRLHAAPALTRAAPRGPPA